MSLSVSVDTWRLLQVQMLTLTAAVKMKMQSIMLKLFRDS